MIQIQGFTNTTYQKFVMEMEARFTSSQTTEIELAQKLGLKSTQTIRNVFRKDTQIVSDEVMSGIMEFLDLYGFIVWMNGDRYYYIKN
jgi:hypothetical protein